jgi:hypothetical protein
MSYRTFNEQFQHYLERPVAGVPGGPVGGSAAWLAGDLVADTTWIVHLTDADIAAMDDALDRVTAAGVEPGDLRRSDVDLGPFASSVREWSRKVSDERGVLLVRGFPVHSWGEQRAALATWCLGLHLGIPGAQNPTGDLLGHVRDMSARGVGQHARLYQTDADIRFHCDYADVVGLMCLRQAIDGGQSRVASSIAVHDELWRSVPNAARRLYQPVWLDARDEGPQPALAVIPFTFDGERVRVFYHSDYFRSAERHGDEFRMSAELSAALDRFDEVAASPEFCVHMDLEPGDLQLLSNHSVVHARTTYRDDPRSPRHLLRLWLSTGSETER